MRLLFGDCVFEPDARRLTRAGRPLALSPKPLLLLEHLLSRRPCGRLAAGAAGRALAGDVRRATTASGQVVTELRRAIGDRRTMPGPDGLRRGLRLRREASWRRRRLAPTVDGRNRLLPALGRPRDPAARGRERGGARPGVRVPHRLEPCLPAPRTDRRARAAASLLDDLGSKNGTHLRGRRVDAPTSLADGDVILLGHEAVVFSAVSPLDTTESEGPSGGTPRRA